MSYFDDLNLPLKFPDCLKNLNKLEVGVVEFPEPVCGIPKKYHIYFTGSVFIK